MKIQPGRREFLAAWMTAALFRQGFANASERVKVVGYLSGGAPPDALTRSLAEQGLVAGRDFRFEVRTPPNWEPATLARAADELVASRPDVLIAWLGNRVGALSKATRTIPIVCGGMPDPVGAGVAASLRRPGGNVTGLSFGFPETAAMTVALLKRLRPTMVRLGFAHPPGTVVAQLRAFETAARDLGIEWRPVLVGSGEDLERVLEPFEAQALMVAPFRDRGLADKIVAVGTRKRIAMIGPPNGALMAYGMEYENAEARVAAILAKVLRGANPAEIPFELPDRPSFVLNRRVARELGLVIPPDVLLRATEVVD